ncbi:DUF1232 domain-containing protein [Lysobacter sp. S4-A87]|uniref:DUF1232 domain-containing protein n=1 Tax=Lysobacter sp. S4-A87 TaxID=2925843 RepID=UPI001F53457C|nr:YkvA family protein [Lysobacter sp. S4-A87]UNK49390.1 DUF1232 domain-containing protein [Lysobacter sp. S4-A87]
MNAIYSAPTSLSAALPSILDAPFEGSGRRHNINGFDLRNADVDRFNGLLARLGRTQTPFEADQLASAARELCDRSIHDFSPPSIRQRLRRIAAVEQMVGDAQWEPANDSVHTAQLIVDYARSRDDLIPDWLPKVGRLDDAIVVDTAWPRLVTEVEDYLDYVRLRSMEAQRRGCAVAAFEFSRKDWEQMRYEEAVYAEHERQIRESSYLPNSVSVFRVH